MAALKLTQRQLESLASRLRYYGDMEVPVGVPTYCALLHDATGGSADWTDRCMGDDDTPRHVDAPALEALLVIAEARHAQARVDAAVPGSAPPKVQTFSGHMSPPLTREFTDPYPEGQAVVSLNPSERPMTDAEMAMRPHAKGRGKIISMGFPALLVLATVKNPAAFAQHVARLLTEDAARKAVA